MNPDNLLAGAIAVELRLLTQPQLDQCIAEQDGSLDPRPIGTLFLEKGFITAKQLERLLEEQRKRLDEFSESRLFGQIALGRNHITASQLGECIREQLRVKPAESRPLLGEVMLKKGYLSLEHFQEVISEQGKSLFHCIRCDIYVAHLSNVSLADALCKKCSDLLRIVQDVGQMENKKKGDTTVFFKQPLANMGKFEVLGEIARGSMGIVIKAYDQTLDRKVALKVLKEGDADEKFIKRLHREASIAARLQHPNIVSIHEVGETEGLHYLCMDYVPGWHLVDFVRVHRIPLNPSLRIFEKIARAVHYAHTQGVVHRDLKPSNILVKKDKTPFVTDFGLAKILDTSFAMTKEGTAIGTPHYMPPEQVMGKLGDIDQRSDVYSLGVILYEMITTQVPHTGSTAMEIYQKILSEEPRRPTDLKDDIDPDLEAICLKAMEKEKQYRYATAEDLAFDLGLYLAGEPVMAAQTSRARLWAKRIRKYKWKILGGVAAFVIGLAIWMAADSMSTASEVSRLVTNGDVLFESGHWAEAMAKYEAAEALDADNTHVIRRIAKCEAHIAVEDQRRKEVAKEEVKEEEKTRRASAQPHYNTGFSRWNDANIVMYQPGIKPEDIDERFREAAEHFTKAISKDPDFSDAHFMRGRCYYELGRFGEAEQDLTKSIGLSEGHSAAHFLRGEIYFSMAMTSDQGKTVSFSPDTNRIQFREANLRNPKSEMYRRKAAEDFQIAVDTSGRDEDRFLMQAFNALALHETFDAVVYFTKSIAYNEANPKAFYGCGFSHMLRGEFEVAVEMIEQALMLKPNLYPAYTILAMARYGKGDVKKALVEFQRAAALFPNSQNWHNLGAMLAMHGFYDDALKAFDKAVELNPRNVEFLHTRGLVLYGLGKFAEACGVAEEVLRQDPKFYEAYKLAAFSFAQMRNLDFAFNYFDRALKINPDDDEILSNYAVMLLELAEAAGRAGEKDQAREFEKKAIRFLNRALRANPASSHAVNIRGVVAANYGRLADAEADFRESIRLDPRNGKAYMNLASILRRADKLKEAKAVLEAGAKNDPGIRREAAAKLKVIQEEMDRKP